MEIMDEETELIKEMLDWCEKLHVEQMSFQIRMIELEMHNPHKSHKSGECMRKIEIALDKAISQLRWDLAYKKTKKERQS